jgi:Ca2+-binding RTX toxin-like protein
MISVAATGAATQQFNSADVDRVTFYGGDGDDLFENNTAISSFFGAHAGNDTFRGGSGNDIVYGGAGMDDLRGNGGDDMLQGGDDVDVVRGGDGDDVLHGNHGDDMIYGDGGDDVLWGEWGNDVIRGGDGNDTVSAFSGDDIIYGDAGDDLVYGQHGDDTIYGGLGNDRLRGNPDNDTIYGEGGHDYLIGDQGDDHLIGGSGNDTAHSWIGNDTLEGNGGNDSLFAGDGDDIVDGGSGNDLIGGEGGNDILRGGSGNDSVYGQGGDDLVYGGAGVDIVVGNDGNDSLFGGDYSSNDTLVGNAGMDRFLVQANNDANNTNRDSINDAASEDAILKFINYDNSWTDAEIEVVDIGFQQLFDVTQNNRLLNDSFDSGDLRLFKYGENSLGGAAGINFLQWSSESQFVNGQWETTYTYNREIRIADWNESSAFFNDQFRSVVLHELAHNWDSQDELINGSGLSSLWDQWLSASGWYESGADNWRYTAPSAAFAEAYGQTNPYEDFATVWELYFSGDAGSVTNGTLQSKLDMLDTLFAAL